MYRRGRLLLLGPVVAGGNRRCVCSKRAINIILEEEFRRPRGDSSLSLCMRNYDRFSRCCKACEWFQAFRCQMCGSCSRMAMVSSRLTKRTAMGGDFDIGEFWLCPAGMHRECEMVRQRRGGLTGKESTSRYKAMKRGCFCLFRGVFFCAIYNYIFVKLKL